MADHNATPLAPERASANRRALNPKQVSAIGMQIASLASNIEAMLAQCIETGGEAHESMVYAETAKHLVQQIGCLADFMSTKIGEPGRVGGVTEWLLPPLYQEGEVEAAQS